MFYSKLYKLADKFAALTDEQYKAVLRNPQMMHLLDRTDRLDEFYRSMPETPLSEIENRLSGISEGIVEKSKKQFPESIEEFLKINGDRQLPLEFEKQMRADILSEDESYSDQEAQRYSAYVEKATWNDILSNYLKSAYYDEEKLNDLLYFFKIYNEIVNEEDLSEKDKNMIATLNKRIVQILITIMKSIFAGKAIEYEAVRRLMRAQKIRKSDYFDFLAGGTIEPIEPAETEYSGAQDIEYPDYRGEPTVPDYRDEPTRK